MTMGEMAPPAVKDGRIGNERIGNGDVEMGLASTKKAALARGTKELRIYTTRRPFE